MRDAGEIRKKRICKKTAKSKKKYLRQGTNFQ